MSNLFTKDEDLLRSAPYVGFEIMKFMQASNKKRISIFDLAKSLQKENKTTARSIYYGMLFLYSLGIIDFDEPYIIKNAKD